MTSRNGHVVVGVDGRAPSVDSVDLAAVEAAVRGVPLRLLWVQFGEPAARRARSGTTEADLSTAEGRRAAATRLAEVHRGLLVSVVTTVDDLAGALVKESERAGLVVVDHRSPARFRGSVAAEVCRGARCPVVVVPSDGDATLRGPVVVAIKNGVRDALAISFAVDEAALRGVALRAVHVWLNTPDMELASVDPYVYDLAEARRDAQRLIQDALDGWPQKRPDVRVQQLPMYRVHVAEALGEASADAGLLVLGSAGRSMRLLASVVGHVRCPVAVVHASDAPAPPSGRPEEMSRRA